MQDSYPLARHGLAHFADRFGASASFLCAAHCAALPFVLALLPALGLGFLADHAFERGFIMGASVFASVTLIRGYQRHRVRSALLFLVPGLMLLWAGGFLFDLHAHLGWHSALVALGGSCVALGHLTNLRLLHGYEHGACCERHGDPRVV
ncbi:MAG: MerC domain-containing protein [Rhodanobacteraceae bacterium]